MDFNTWIWVSLAVTAAFAFGVIYGMHVCEEHQKKMFKTWRDANGRN